MIVASRVLRFRVSLGIRISPMSSHKQNHSPQPVTARNLGVPPPPPAPTNNPTPEPGLTMSITHRLNTGGSVQALTVLADDYLIVGLQGGVISVSSKLSVALVHAGCESPARHS